MDILAPSSRRSRAGRVMGTGQRMGIDPHREGRVVVADVLRQLSRLFRRQYGQSPRELRAHPG